jgi:copper chaperone CopZ
MESCCQSKREVSDGMPMPVGASEMTFRVQGMDCSEEVAAIERALKPIGGVLGVRANLVASSISAYTTDQREALS